MKKGLFVGLTNIDLVYYIDDFPQENSKCKTNKYSKYIGGPAANAAITYSLLGGDATLITAFGNSKESVFIMDTLNEYGVKVINLSDDVSLPGMSSILVSNNGNRTIISGQSIYNDIDLSLIGELKFDFALFDLNQQDVSISVLNRIKCPVIIDAGTYKENTEVFLNKAQIVISSEKFEDNSGNNIFKMIYPSIEHKAITRGDKSILTENGEIEVDKVDSVDTLAAGDIFHGAFCFGFYELELEFNEALNFASKIASESVKYYGPRQGVYKR